MNYEFVFGHGEGATFLEAWASCLINFYRINNTNGRRPLPN